MSAEKTGDLKETKSQQRQRHKSSSSPESTGSSGVSSSLTRQASSDSGNYQKAKTPPSLKRGSSQDPIIAQQAALMSQTETAPVVVCTSPNYSPSELPELISTSPHNASLLHGTRPLILQHPQSHSHVGAGSGDEGGNGTYINWLYDFYPNVLGGSPKDKLGQFPDHPHGKLEFSSPTNTVFRSQEKYVVTLGAPISIAQQVGDDTLTYLNKGQFYNLYVKANSSMSMPEQVKSMIFLNFFDEPDHKVEFSHWQYWYNLQANPNQKAFDIDRKNCETVQGKVEDLGYNGASFVWRPDLGVKVVLRINCLSTEFSSQKGVKGIPLHLVVDTYEDLDTEGIEPVHRGYCRVKIFRDKGAERKNKDETKSMERRMQKFMKQPGVDSDLGTSSVFHPPSKETVLNSTSTFGPKPFIFIPQQDSASASMALPPSKLASTTLLANIRDRETKRTFSNTLIQAKEDLDHLEVATPAKKVARIPTKPLTTVYVRKEEEKVYNAIMLDSLTVHDLKLQIAKKYDVPADMIKNVFKKTKRGLLVHFDDEMVGRFLDEDDFIIDMQFDNQKGCFDLYVFY